MAGGPLAEHVVCAVCLDDGLVTKATRVYEGIEDDHYSCERGHAFGIDWGGRPATEPQWPPAGGDAPAAVIGCGDCLGAEPDAAWAHLSPRRGPELLSESHASIDLARCSCGQAFAVVFTERVDFDGDGDDLTWLVLPITPDEARALEQVEPAQLAARLSALGPERRFLLRSEQAGTPTVTRWRDGGFAVRI